MRSTIVGMGIMFFVSALRVDAQVVRGTARESTTGIPIPGVLVTLEPAEGASILAPLLDRSALTNQRGEYALRAPAPGRYHVSAKRIGVQRYFSPAFTLAAGETRRLDLDLDATTRALEEVIVTADALCVTHPSEATRVAAMWDDIRAGLSATTISARDRLVVARVSRYARLLDPRSLRVLREAREDLEGLVHRPFASPSADSLSTHGYWGPTAADTLAFFGPDVEVLASDAFRRDHCFAVAVPVRGREGLSGLTFEPAEGRRVPDLRGVLWIDAGTSELQLVEFRYTNLPRIQYAEHVRGEVWFSRLSSGAWIVRRWYIRMPRYAYAHRTGRTERLSTQHFQLPRIDQLLEEGGQVSGEALRGNRDRVVVRGSVRDSAGNPFAGAQVRVVGTDLVTAVDGAGRFVFEGLAAGFYALTAAHAGYAAYGVPAAESELAIEPGRASSVALRAFDTEGLATRMCTGRAPGTARLAMRVTIIDSLAGTPVTGEQVRLTWLEYETKMAGAVAVRTPRAVVVNGTTDDAGAVTVCQVPNGITVDLGYPVGERAIRRIDSFNVPERRVWSVVVRTAGRR